MADTDIRVRVLFEQAGVKDIDAMLKQLEQVGVKWNATAGRFQEIQGVAGGSKFVSGDTVKQSIAELQVEQQVTAQKEQQAAAAAYMAQMQTRDLDAGKQIAEWAKVYEVSIEEAARLLAGTMSVNGRAMEPLVQDANAYVDSLGAAKQEADGLQDTLEKVEKNTAKTSGLMMGMVGMRLTRTGMMLEQAGKAVLSPMSAYVTAEGTSDEASRRYLAAQHEIESSTQRVGKIMVEEVLPTFEKVAQFASEAADFVEAHPGVAGALVNIGGTTFGIGALTMAVGQIWTGVYAFNQVGKWIVAKLGTGTATAAATQAATGASVIEGGGLAAIIAAVAPAAIAASVAMLGYNAIAGQPGYGESLKPGLSGATEGAERTVAMYWTMNAALLGKFSDTLGITDTAALDWGKAVSKATGLEEEHNKQAGAGKTLVTLTEVQAFIDAQKAETKATEENAQQRAALETKYEEERTQTVQQQGAARAQKEDDFERQRSETVASHLAQTLQEEQDFARETSQMTDDHNAEEAQKAADNARQRAKMISDAAAADAKAQKETQDQIAKLRADHLKRLHDLEVEHKDREDDLIAKRDALGLAAERKSYKEKVDKENADYKSSLAETKKNAAQAAAQRKADFQKQLAEFDAQAKRETVQRQAQFDREMERRDQEEAIKKQREEADFQAQLKKMDDDHKVEMERWDKEAADKLKALDQAHTKEMNDLQKQYNEERKVRADNLRQQMSDLLGIEEKGYDDMKKAAQSYADDLLAEAKRLGLDVSGSATPGKAAGGYANEGIYHLGEGGLREFVLNGGATRGAEKLLGPLSNENILAALSIGSLAMHQVGSGASYNMAAYFPSGTIMTQMERMITRASKQAALEVFGSILG